MAENISNERIKTFMEGHDPMQRIVNILYKYQDNFVTVVYRDSKDNKCYLKQPFFPFVWATLHACKALCGGDRQKLVALMNRYGIGVKKLSNVSVTGEEIHAFDNGYMFLFFAKKPMSQTQFQSFFREAGNPIYGKKSKNGKEELRSAIESRQYLSVTPQEQYMIATGRRFFKGYDDYDQLLKMTFDLETTGLDKKKDRIIQIGIRMNRPFNGYPKGYKVILDVTGDTEEDKDACELWAIDTMFKMIAQFKPDIITAHNGENFDWEMIIGACDRLGVSAETLSGRHFNGETIKKEDKESVLKLGGEIEKFRRTIVPETIVTDSLHAVRRAQATDSNFLRADLKYSTDYLGIRKPNRVYTPGSEISKIWHDNNANYAFNNKNGDWYYYNPDAPDIVIEDTIPNPDFNIEYFQNELNDDRLPAPDIEEVIKMFEKDTSLAEEWVNNPKLYITNWKEEHNQYPADITAEDLYNQYLDEIKKENEEKHRFKLGKEDKDKPFIMYTRNYIAEGYELKTGKYIVERYLYDDLWECDKVEHKLNTTNFLICKLLPVTYSKATTMGTAGQWKMLMLAWSYENNLAVPLAENSGSFTGGLSRLLKVGYVDNVVKLDYNSLYPSIILTWGIHDETDLSNAMLRFLEYVLTEREKYKGLKKKAGKIVDAFEERINAGEKLNENELNEYHQAQADYAFNDKKQNQMKVFGNSFFGSYGSNNGSVFPWKSPKCAEQTTCTGRQSLRLMISHFHDLGYQPIVGDSFTSDTPLFVKYDENGAIDIKPIEELINENGIEIDALGREYDYSKKSYKVLCRTGWMTPTYIYRHKTDKDIYEVSEGNMKIDVTEDHSLFDSDKQKLNPKTITEDTKLEYYKKDITKDLPQYKYGAYQKEDCIKLGKQLATGEIDRVPIGILNSSVKWYIKWFYQSFMENWNQDIKYSKTCLAGLQYIRKRIL